MTRRRNAAAPADLFALWARNAQMLYETQMIISMRMLGMAGLWSVTPRENARMVNEKAPALLASAGAAQQAVLAGKRADQVMEAALRPFERKTRSNMRRLSRRGPKMN